MLSAEEAKAAIAKLSAVNAHHVPKGCLVMKRVGTPKIAIYCSW